jgi:hypothetical protein
VKTAVEVTCGTVRGRLVARPVACLHVTREILLEHERNEQRVYRRYTFMALSAILPGVLALALGGLSLTGKRRKRESA